jgi:hypothetical protein
MVHTKYMDGRGRQALSSLIRSYILTVTESLGCNSYMEVPRGLMQYAVGGVIIICNNDCYDVIPWSRSQTILCPCALVRISWALL